MSATNGGLERKLERLPCAIMSRGSSRTLTPEREEDGNGGSDQTQDGRTSRHLWICVCRSNLPIIGSLSPTSNPPDANVWLRS